MAIEINGVPVPEGTDTISAEALQAMVTALTGQLNTHLAEFAQYKKRKGVLLAMTGSITIPNSAFTFLPWDSVVYDTSGFYNSGQPTRITIPAGVSKVKVSSNVCFNINANGPRQAQIQKNNADTPGSGSSNIVAGGTVYDILNVASAVLPVEAGDYFEVRVLQTSGGSLATRNFAAAMWFSLEVVE